MIELHFHCLPGIDDGPRTWDEAVELCRHAEADGTHAIVATPHVLRDSWLNEDPSARALLVDELNRRLGGSPKVLPGCEYYFSADAMDLAYEGGPLTRLAGSSYLLVEFPATMLPAAADDVFHELSIHGVRPLIAHPERNLVFASRPEKLQRLVELGAVTQLTAGSIAGDFGAAAYKACEEFITRGLAHIVASDAHSISRRPPRMTAARQKIRQKWSAEIETALFDTNPRAVLENQPLPFNSF